MRGACFATLAAAAALLCAACSVTPEVADEEPWTRIVRGSTGERVSRATLTAALREADYILLGEIHDNEIHHRLQWVVLHELSPRPLVMEQLDVELQPAIDAAVQARGDADAIAAAANMNTKAWSWPLYKPLVQLALDRGAPIVAGNLSRKEAREVASKGFGVLPDAEALAINPTWNAQREASLLQEIVDSHCGQLKAEDAGGIAKAQRARDAVMADRMLRHVRGVLIAGSGHARLDRGVPAYLRQRAPKAKVLSLAFVEGNQDAAGAQNYDFVWITAAQPRKDPCAAGAPVKTP